MPNLIGFFVFTFVGAVFSLFMSFTDWSLIKPLSEVKFVFLKNYTQLVSDRWFIASVKNNVWFLLIVPIQMFLALLVAVILNGKVFFRNFLRTSFYLANVTSIVAISVVWFTPRAC